MKPYPRHEGAVLAHQNDMVVGEVKFHFLKDIMQ
eukprot:UN13150